MSTAFQRLYKLAEGISQNEEKYMPQPFGDDPEHKSSMDPVNPEPLGITQPKEDGNQFTGSKTAHQGLSIPHALPPNFSFKKTADSDHTTTQVYKFPNCDFCGKEARYDSKTHGGPWGYTCEGCFKTQTPGKLGLGVGQRLVIGSVKTADRSNTDESGSPGGVGAPKHVYKVDVEDPPGQQLFGDAGETSRGDGSIEMTGSTLNLESRKIVHAYVVENGSPTCSVCKEYYTPKSIADAKLAHCGHCPEDRMDEAMGRTPPGETHGTWNTPAEAGSGRKIVSYGPDDGNPELNRIEEGDVVDGNVIKTAPREASRKLSNDSELYTRGFLDHLHGKLMDEDLAVLSDDYFNGYDQARFYGKTPLESVGAKPHKVTQPASPDGSLEGWAESGIGGQDYKYDVDRSQVIASTLPTNVLEEFFNTEE